MYTLEILKDGFTFNSLYEIQIIKSENQYALMYFQFSLWDSFSNESIFRFNINSFQFSLWDSEAPSIAYANKFFYSFNSLYEILGDYTLIKQADNLISFNSLYEILLVSFWFWNKNMKSFQFSLWDSWICRRRSRSDARKTFNSLYEIQLKMKYEIIDSDIFQFSLWDSITTKLQEKYEKLRWLSILFMRFIAPGKITKMQGGSRLSILFMRFLLWLEWINE